MSKNVIALYDNFEDARDAVEALVDAGFQRDNISLVANDASGEYANYVERDNDDVSAGEGAGFGAVVGTLAGLGVALIPGVGPVLAAGPLAVAAMAGIGAAAGAATGGIVAGLVDMGVPEDEAGHYAEGVRRGGVLVTIAVDDQQVQRAQDIMNRYQPIDVNRRSTHWQQSGYQGFNTNAEPWNANQIQTERNRIRELDAGEEVELDVMEEELQVGKREVERGGVRVTSRIVERPVHEDVRLRDEEIHVERRPVDRRATDADMNAFREGTIEVHEHDEEAVVSKQARVIEEVVISKDARERTESIDETVRRTEVDVQDATETGNQYGQYETYDSGFRNHFQTAYQGRGYTYTQIQPAYRFGYILATDNRYRDYDWNRLEPEARRHWEERNPNTWDEFSGSVRHAWETTRNRR